MQIIKHLGALAIVVSMSCGEQTVVRETEASCGNASIETGEAAIGGQSIS